MIVFFTVPIRTHSKLNQRIHWAARAKQAKTERLATYLAAFQSLKPRRKPVTFPCTVRLTRVSPRSLDDDNLRGALKAVRDEVASMLGVDDRDPRVTWAYAQEKGKPSVCVEVRSPHDPREAR